MIKKALLAACPLLLAAPLTQAADWSVTPTIVSDYDFRGITQTALDPAFQLGATLTGESGLYGFIWGSNLDDDSYPEADLELDLGFGFAGGDAEMAVGYDLGFVYYGYPGESDFDYLEVYAGISKNWFSGKIWYSPAFGGDAGEALAEALTGDDNASAFYIEGNGTFPLPQDFGLVVHLGFSDGDYWDAVADSYFDFAIGVTKSFGNFDFALKYIDGSDLEDVPGTDVFDSGSKGWLSVSTTLPWGE
jgi:uncharacterized protein (TIGR02001 family)